MSEELKAAQARIACLEGEIAKRDETIARLEPQLNRAIQANYDLREELAACRIAVENCEVFRVRIAELEQDLAYFPSTVRSLAETVTEREAEINQLRAELAAIKAQEPIGWYTEDHLDDKSATTYSWTVAERWVEKGWPVSPLYASPVSEAKARGVVQWPDADEIMQMAFEEGQPADDASGYCFELEEFDLFIERLMSEVARLNATHVQQPKCKTCNDNGRIGGPSFYAPDEGGEPCPDCSATVQQVSVPDASTDFSQFLSAVMDAAGLVRHGRRSKELSEYLGSKCMEYRCFAAPAAPAADAGLVDALGYQVLFDAIAAATSVYANGAINISVQAFRDALAAHCAKGVV